MDAWVYLADPTQPLGENELAEEIKKVNKNEENSKREAMSIEPMVVDFF